MHRYRSRQDFLKDVTQIVHNSTKFNGVYNCACACHYCNVPLLGSESVFTKTTEAMKEVSLEALDEVSISDSP